MSFLNWLWRVCPGVFCSSCMTLLLQNGSNMTRSWFVALMVFSGLCGVSVWGIHASFKVTFFIPESRFHPMIRLSLFLSRLLEYSWYSNSLLQERSVRSISHIHSIICFTFSVNSYYFIYIHIMVQADGRIVHYMTQADWFLSHLAFCLKD